MVPVTGTTGRMLVLAGAIVVLIAFLLWSRRTRSYSFFLGVLAGSGLVLSFDVIWVHSIFGFAYSEPPGRHHP